MLDKFRNACQIIFYAVAFCIALGIGLAIVASTATVMYQKLITSSFPSR